MSAKEMIPGDLTWHQRSMLVTALYAGRIYRPRFLLDEFDHLRALGLVERRAAVWGEYDGDTLTEDGARLALLIAAEGGS